MMRCAACRWRGSHEAVRKRDLEGKTGVLVCPECERDRVVLGAAVIVKAFTTQLKTSRSGQYHWVKFRRSREMTGGHVWVFTDGSSTGSCAAVVIDGRNIEELVRHPLRPPTWNVGAELGGVVLGINHTPRDRRVVVVSDYIGSAGFISGRWAIRDPDTLKRVIVIASLIRRRGLVVSFIHHGGHQRDPSAFTRFNNHVDSLASTDSRRRFLARLD